MVRFLVESNVDVSSTALVVSSVVEVDMDVVVLSSGMNSGGNDVGAALIIEKLLLSNAGGSTASLGTHSESTCRFDIRCPWISHFDVNSTIGPQMVTHIKGMSSTGSTSAATTDKRP